MYVAGNRQRFGFGIVTLSVFAVMGLTPSVAQSPPLAPAQTICDTLSAAPWDPDVARAAVRVEFKDMRADLALPACQTAAAAAPEDRTTLFQLGRVYDKLGRNQEAFEAYRLAVNFGSRAAMVNIGILFQQGRSFEKNDVKARAWYKRAAEAGIPEGAFCYGTALDNGIGGPPDEAGAIQQYRRAAAAGTRKAATVLARLRVEGMGTGTRCD